MKSHSTYISVLGTLQVYQMYQAVMQALTHFQRSALMVNSTQVMCGFHNVSKQPHKARSL